MDNHDKSFIKKRYAEVALSQQPGCGCSCGTAASSCCGEPSENSDPGSHGMQLGYSQEELDFSPNGANLGLGCGNPQAIADMKPGEVVVDLGSGAGFDCFLAARQVGREGKVIGIDMTEEMVEKARRNALKLGFRHVEFILGEIEDIPLPDDTADVVISNCVINLSPDKLKVFQEAFRVLKPGGRLAVSDIVTMEELPADIKQDRHLHSACIAGASPIDDIIRWMESSGFKEISVVPKHESREFIKTWAPGTKAEDYIVSADIRGKK